MTAQTKKPKRNKPNTNNRPRRNNNSSHQKPKQDNPRPPRVHEPIFKISIDKIDPIKGFEFALDWKPELIEYLRNNGFMGTSDESIVQKFIAGLYMDIMEKIQPESHSEYE
jgi:hypothetical protein